MESLLRQPKGLVLCESSGVVIVCDSGNHCLRLLHPTKQGNLFYTSTLEEADVNTTRGAQEPLRPFRLDHPTDIEVLNGDGTAEVVAVTHDHGITVIAIDMKSSVVLGSQLVAGRTSSGGRSTSTTTSSHGHSRKMTSKRNLVSSAAAMALRNVPYGYIDGNPTTAKFHSPAGLMLGHNQSLYICDSKNGSIRHLLAGSV